MDKEKLRKVRSICWALTTKCNLNCPLCYAYQSDNDELNIDRPRLLNKVKELGIPIITFAGGDPLLCSELPSLIRHAKSIGLYTNLATNGLLLSLELIREIAPFLDELTLPLEGSIERIHVLNRGSSSEEQFYNTISLLEKVKGQPFQTAVGTVMTAHNLDDLRMLAELLLFLQIKRWKIYRFYPLARSAERKQEYSVSDEDVCNAKEQLKPFTQDIDIVLIDNNTSTFRSYLMLSPNGNLIIVRDGKYTKLADISDCTDIIHLLTLNDFNFNVHTSRKYRDQ